MPSSDIFNPVPAANCYIPLEEGFGIAYFVCAIAKNTLLLEEARSRLLQLDFERITGKDGP